MTRIFMITVPAAPLLGLAPTNVGTVGVSATSHVADVFHEALVDVVLASVALVARVGAVAPVGVDQVDAAAAVQTRTRRALVNVHLAVRARVARRAKALVGLAKKYLAFYHKPLCLIFKILRISLVFFNGFLEKTLT